MFPDEFTKWCPTNWNAKKKLKEMTVKNMYVNFGPAHPAAHGVLRMVLQMQGEVIMRADPHIGLLVLWI